MIILLQKKLGVYRFSCLFEASSIERTHFKHRLKINIRKLSSLFFCVLNKSETAVKIELSINRNIKIQAPETSFLV